MSRKKLATAIACAVFTGAACASGVSAAEVYELNPVLVTAQRSVTKDMETPAAIEILHADDLQKTGATSVQEALKFSTGIITHGQGPRNISQGTMTSKAVIRGVEKGTLVLIDGVPINQGGRYNLEDIPVESIDRVEVVRGGGRCPVWLGGKWRRHQYHHQGQACKHGQGRIWQLWHPELCSLLPGGEAGIHCCV